MRKKSNDRLGMLIKKLFLNDIVALARDCSELRKGVTLILGKTNRANIDMKKGKGN